MDKHEFLEKYKEFFLTFYHGDLLDMSLDLHRFVLVDFRNLCAFSPDLAENLLDCPKDAIMLAETAVQTIVDTDLKIRVRFENLPQARKVNIREIRAIHLDKLIWIEGYIRQKSDARPLVTRITFECPGCGTLKPVLQLENLIKEPKGCSCGYRGKLREGNKVIVDAQGMVIEEPTETLEGGEQPKRLKVFLKEDLVSPLSDKRTTPGTKVIVAGIIKEVPILKHGGKSTQYDIILEANWIEPANEELSEVILTEEDKEQIFAINKDPHCVARLIASIAPSIYGYQDIKEALLLQLFGGVKRDSKEQGYRRGDIHILLCSDPGKGKSFLLKRMQAIAPKSRFISGKSSTGAGIIGSVVKDEFTGSWGLEAGAMVLANRSLLLADEFEKMDNHDRAAMHEAMERQEVNINKANIHCTLNTETSVLAAANPKKGRFDLYVPIASQLDLPPSLINRFCLIFPMLDVPEESQDNRIAEFILDIHAEKEQEKGIIPTGVLRNYVSYARKNFTPSISKEAMDVIKDYYVKLRKLGEVVEGSPQTPIPISPRQLEAIVRLSQASAKMRLSHTVNTEDAQRAVRLLHGCLTAIGMDPETGKIDIDRIVSSTSFSQRTKLQLIESIINELDKEYGRSIPIDKIYELALEKKIQESKVDELLNTLKQTGAIFEPRRGTWGKVI